MTQMISNMACAAAALAVTLLLVVATVPPGLNFNLC